MNDERIQSTINRFAAGGFFLWYILTLISLDYRLLILKQPARAIWDFIAIFLIVNVFIFMAYAQKGMFDNGFKRLWIPIGITIIITILALSFFMGQIQSIGDVSGTLGGVLLGLGIVIAIVYVLNRRWRRKEGLDDEQ